MKFRIDWTAVKIKIALALATLIELAGIWVAVHLIGIPFHWAFAGTVLYYLQRIMRGL